jgi:hypothetical protein
MTIASFLPKMAINVKDGYFCRGAQHPLADGPWVFNRETLQTAAAATLIERVTNRNRQPAVPNSEQATFEFSST